MEKLGGFDTVFIKEELCCPLCTGMLGQKFQTRDGFSRLEYWKVGDRLKYSLDGHSSFFAEGDFLFRVYTRCGDCREIIWGEMVVEEGVVKGVMLSREQPGQYVLIGGDGL